MGCDCKKTYNIGMGCCQPVLAPADNYYTKYQTDLRIEEEISGLTGSTGCCITPEEVDEKIASAKTEIEAEIPSLSGYATEQWVETQGYITEHQPIKTINGQSLIGTGDIEIGTGGTIDLSNYYTTAQTVNLVESAVTIVEGEIPTVPTSNTAFTNDANYITINDVSGKTDISAFTAHTADTTVHVTSVEKNTWNAKPDIWCGSEQEWSQISGSTTNGTIYLVY